MKTFIAEAATVERVPGLQAAQLLLDPQQAPKLFCYVCAKLEEEGASSKRCSGCGEVYYFSQQHQTED